MRNYSQNAEQDAILAYFGNKVGTFLDIGANDGVTLSNTRALSDLKWTGHLIEPSPRAYKWLVQYLPTWCTAYDVAISSSDGYIDFYESGEHLKIGDVGLLSTAKLSELKRWKTSGEVFQKITVRSMTFETFYLMISEPPIDFISIDAEGLDYDILTGIDFNKTGTSCVCVEYNANEISRDLMTKYCEKFGMKEIYRSYENLIFAK